MRVLEREGEVWRLIGLRFEQQEKGGDRETSLVVKVERGLRYDLHGL